MIKSSTLIFGSHLDVINLRLIVYYDNKFKQIHSPSLFSKGRKQMTHFRGTYEPSKTVSLRMRLHKRSWIHGEILNKIGLK